MKLEWKFTKKNEDENWTERWEVEVSEGRGGKRNWVMARRGHRCGEVSEASAPAADPSLPYVFGCSPVHSTVSVSMPSKSAGWVATHAIVAPALLSLLLLKPNVNKIYLVEILFSEGHQNTLVFDKRIMLFLIFCMPSRKYDTKRFRC